MLGFKDDKILGWNIGLALGAKEKFFYGIMLTDGILESAFGTFYKKSDGMIFVDEN